MSALVSNWKMAKDQKVKGKDKDITAGTLKGRNFNFEKKKKIINSFNWNN